MMCGLEQDVILKYVAALSFELWAAPIMYSWWNFEIPGERKNYFFKWNQSTWLSSACAEYLTYFLS